MGMGDKGWPMIIRAEVRAYGHILDCPGLVQLCSDMGPAVQETRPHNLVMWVLVYCSLRSSDGKTLNKFLTRPASLLQPKEQQTFTSETV